MVTIDTMNINTAPDINTTPHLSTADTALSVPPSRAVVGAEAEATFLTVIGELDIVDAWNGRGIAWLTEIDRLRAHGHRIRVGVES